MEVVYGKIQKKLFELWTPSQFDKGKKSRVIISIDNMGNFSYLIKSLSSNDDFNNRLKLFLQSLINIKFPPYLEGDKTNIEVTFGVEES